MEKQVEARGQQLQQKGECSFEGPRKLEVKHICQDARSIWLLQEEEWYENLNRQICWYMCVTERTAEQSRRDQWRSCVVHSFIFTGLCHDRDSSSLSLSMILSYCLSSEKLQQGHMCVSLSLPHTSPSMCKNRQNLASEGLHHKVWDSWLPCILFYG